MRVVLDLLTLSSALIQESYKRMCTEDRAGKVARDDREECRK